MARKRARVHTAKFKSQRYVNPARDPFVIANAPALRRISSPRRDLVVRFSTPHPVEDRRLWHPERANRPALSFSGNPAPVVIGRTRSVGRKTGWPSHAVKFKNPDQVLVCLRRSRRREVILASGGPGKKSRRPKFSWRSKIHCKR